MWFKNEESKNVFITQDRGFFYELSNEEPKPGDYVLVSLEHDPTHIVKVKSFDKNSDYPINSNYRFGAQPLEYVKEEAIRFYGVGKIEWTSNLDLQRTENYDGISQFNFWSKKNPNLTLEYFI